jgi:DNA polymerase III delta prime subunit
MSSPWIEKYRPKSFDNIVLDPMNRQIFENIIKQNNIPNLIFYGPPGTGKTTTIINLINKYQEKYNQRNKGLMIHLNASDERGIDVIRNQINSFVNTKTLFTHGIKFIILDEVDYMTKNAQQALKYLIQQYNKNIRFCLICNYISRLDYSLQNEFIRLRFSQLPKQEINHFLKNIVKKEKLNISQKQLEFIQNKFNSDIRSMINFLQSNYQNIDKNLKILSHTFFENCNNKLSKKKNILKFLNQICERQNIRKREFIIHYISFLLKTNIKLLSYDTILAFKFIIHNQCINENYLFNYFGGELDKVYKVL